MAGKTVFIGMGSNLGDPLDLLKLGIDGMRELSGLELIKVSSPYRTAPVGPQDQPPFINAVAVANYQGEANQLLKGLLSVEKIAGRERLRRWGPRTLDLDLLLFAEDIIDEPGLKVPHPEMFRRAFVLVPLNELAPDIILPLWNRTPGELLAAMEPEALAEQKVEKIAWD